MLELVYQRSDVRSYRNRTTFSAKVLFAGAGDALTGRSAGDAGTAGSAVDAVTRRRARVVIRLHEAVLVL